MSLLDEEIVEYWLNNRGFFCMRGVKTGLGEIDFLAIRPCNGEIEAWHVEVTVSFRPIGYIGGDSSAKKRDQAAIQAGVKQYIEKKFLNPKKAEKRESLIPGANWRWKLVHANLKDNAELEYFVEKGVDLIGYRQILEELSGGISRVNSTAGNIVELLRYARNEGITQ